MRARVDVRQRRFTRHAKLGSGHNDEVKVEFDRTQYKCVSVEVAGARVLFAMVTF